MNGRRFTQAGIPAIVALLLIAVACGFLVKTQTPYGAVSGVVLMTDSGKPLADAEVYLNPGKKGDDSSDDSNDSDADAENRRSVRRRTTTDAHGRFTIQRVAAGAYHLSAEGQYHDCDPVNLTVREAHSASATLRLKRSSDDLDLSAYQKIWTQTESPHLPIKGYVDAKKGEFDAIRLTVYKARLSTILAGTNSKTADDLQNVQDGSNQSKRLPDSLLHPSHVAPADQPRLVSQTEVPIQSPDREGFYEQRIVVPAKGPGLYLAQIDHAGKSVCAWVLVTNTGLVVKRAGNRLLTYAVDLVHGTPIAGAQVRQYRAGAIVAQATAGADGLATLMVPAPPKKPKASGDGDDSDDSGGSSDAKPSRAVTVAVHGDDEAVLSANDGNFTQSSDDYAVYAYTDRTIYRPGQSIAFKGVVRKKAPSGVGRLYDGPSANLPVTVEVRDPNGDRLLHTTLATNRWGSYAGGFNLAAEAPTGSYSLITTVNGEKHTSDIMVASYRKPEFAVTVKPKKNHYVRGETVEMTVSARYYYGAPVAGASVNYSIYRDTDWDEIYAGDSDPDDRDPSQENTYYGQMLKNGTIKLDEKGEATVTVETDPKKERAEKEAAGDKSSDSNDSGDDNVVDTASNQDQQVVTCDATVTDDAKREVESKGQAHLSPGDYILTLTPEGYLAKPGQPSTVVATARDYDGKPVANLPVVFAAAYEHTTKGGGTKTVAADLNQKVTTGAGGRVVVTLTPQRSGTLNLRTTAYDTKGHVLHASAEIYAVSDGGGDLNTDYSDLSLLTDKKKYGPGESARVLINTARVGQSVLLTVEGERVYRSVVLPIRQKSTVTTIPIDATWGPNVTLAACYVRDKKMAQSEVPLRVRLDQQTVNVTVKADKLKLRPGDKVTYAIHTASAQTGKPVACEVSLAVVDESLFALRADNPYALRDAFYPKRENQVSTSYSFEVAYMGDTDKSEPTIEMRRKFMDTAFWQPQMETDANGDAHATVTLPDNLTTWRATVQAVSADTQVGRVTGQVLVTKPFFLRLDTPRFLTQTDEGRFLTLLHNDTGTSQTVHVKLTAPGLIAEGTPAEQTLTVADATDGQVVWPVKAQRVGIAPIRAEAWTDGRDPATGKQYTDGIETTLPVRAWGREQFTAIAGIVKNGGAGEGRPIDIDTAALPTETKLSVRLLPGVGASIAPALDYLVGYPYGCTEQTMSRIYPDLLVQRTEKQTAQTLLRGANAEKRRNAMPRMVQNGILRLRRFQHASGAWGWWEQDEDNAALTAYVLEGLSIAKAQGFDVPAPMLENARKGGLALLTKTTSSDRPALLYGLALVGETDKPRRLLRAANSGDSKTAGMNLAKLPPDALARLVLMARRLNEDFRPAWNALQRREVAEGDLLHWANPDGYWNGSDATDTALALRAMIAVDGHDTRIGNVLRYLMLQRGDGYWQDTRSTANILAALTDYLALHPEDAAPPTGSVAVQVDGKTVQTVDLAASGNGDERELTVPVAASLLPRGKHTLTVAGAGVGGTVFYSGALRQVVAAPGDAGLAAVTNPDITVKREYLRVGTSQKDGVWSLHDDEVPGDKFKQDDNLHVRLTITAARSIDYVLIEDEFPSNCEPTERGTAEDETAGTEGEWSFWYSNIDVRDDRIAFFATHLEKGTHTVEYNLRAQTPGVTRALPAQAQAMYAPAIRAESADTCVEVTP